MPIPPNAVTLEQPLDPSDIRRYGVDLSQAPLPDTPANSNKVPFLEEGEGVQSFTLALNPEAVAAGLVINTTGGRATTISGLSVRFWLSVDPASQASTAFDGSGVTLPIELTVDTTFSPSQRKQKTIAVRVANQ